MIDYKKFNDAIKTKDTLRGHFVLKDEKGNILEDKDNLIVLRSRLFVLLHLFKPDDETREEMESAYIRNDNRRICLFKIGMGGADIQSAPFQPFVPKFTDRDLANPIPFVVTNDVKELDPELNANPSVFLPDKHNFDKNKRETYHCKKLNVDDSASYFAKTFDNVEFNFNTDSNEMYAELLLTIDNWDARGYFFNELGLMMAEEIYVKVNPDLDIVSSEPITEAEYKEGIANGSLNAEEYMKQYRDIELFSRVTFGTKSLKTLNNKLIIEYRIYV